MSRDKLPLVVGIGLPIILIVYLFIVIYIPSFFVKPMYDFVYSTGYLYDYDVQVVGGRINLQQRNYNNTYVPPQVTLFLYDTQNDKSTAITIDEAQRYILDPTNKSPDGFIVGRSDSDDFYIFPFFFGGGYQRGVFLMGKGLNRKIIDQEYDFKFLGWVLNKQ